MDVREDSVVLRVPIAAVTFKRESRTNDYFTRKSVPATRLEILDEDGECIYLSGDF